MSRDDTNFYTRDVRRIKWLEVHGAFDVWLFSSEGMQRAFYLEQLLESWDTQEENKDYIRDRMRAWIKSIYDAIVKLSPELALSSSNIFTYEDLNAWLEKHINYVRFFLRAYSYRYVFEPTKITVSELGASFDRLEKEFEPTARGVDDLYSYLFTENVLAEDAACEDIFLLKAGVEKNTLEKDLIKNALIVRYPLDGPGVHCYWTNEKGEFEREVILTRAQVNKLLLGLPKEAELEQDLTKWDSDEKARSEIIIESNKRRKLSLFYQQIPDHFFNGMMEVSQKENRYAIEAWLIKNCVLELFSSYLYAAITHEYKFLTAKKYWISEQKLKRKPGEGESAIHGIFFDARHNKLCCQHEIYYYISEMNQKTGQMEELFESTLRLTFSISPKEGVLHETAEASLLNVPLSRKALAYQQELDEVLAHEMAKVIKSKESVKPSVIPFSVDWVFSVAQNLKREMMSYQGMKKVNAARYQRAELLITLAEAFIKQYQLNHLSHEDCYAFLDSCYQIQERHNQFGHHWYNKTNRFNEALERVLPPVSMRELIGENKNFSCAMSLAIVEECQHRLGIDVDHDRSLMDLGDRFGLTNVMSFSGYETIVWNHFNDTDSFALDFLKEYFLGEQLVRKSLRNGLEKMVPSTFAMPFEQTKYSRQIILKQAAEVLFFLNPEDIVLLKPCLYKIFKGDETLLNHIEHAAQLSTLLSELLSQEQRTTIAKEEFVDHILDSDSLRSQGSIWTQIESFLYRAPIDQLPKKALEIKKILKSKREVSTRADLAVQLRLFLEEWTKLSSERHISEKLFSNLVSCVSQPKFQSQLQAIHKNIERFKGIKTLQDLSQSIEDLSNLINQAKESMTKTVINSSNISSRDNTSESVLIIQLSNDFCGRQVGPASVGYYLWCVIDKWLEENEEDKTPVVMDLPLLKSIEKIFFALDLLNHSIDSDKVTNIKNRLRDRYKEGVTTYDKGLELFSEKAEERQAVETVLAFFPESTATNGQTEALKAEAVARARLHAGTLPGISVFKTVNTRRVPPSASFPRPH